MIENQQRHRIIREIDGKSYEGNYWVAGKLLVVSTAKGGASARLDHRVPKVLAEEVLRKLATEGKA